MPVVIHNVPTSTPSTDEGFLSITTEVQTFIPGITLHRTLCWLTKPEQRVGKQSSSMVLSIAGRPSVTEALKGLLLFGRRLMCTPYICFDASTHCKSCLRLGHHCSRCTGSPSCAICAHLHNTWAYSCSRPKCTLKTTSCLHNILLCSNCGTTIHKGNSQECTDYLTPNNTASNRRNRMQVDDPTPTI